MPRDEIMNEFTYEPSACVPFRDSEAISRARRIKREEITLHPNPDFRISVVPDADVMVIFITDMFYRIKKSAEEGTKVVLILPNPVHAYRFVAHMINRFRVDCGHVHCFMMDEYADEHGNVAPETWPQGFLCAFKKHFYANIDPGLRPPENQICGPTTKNIGHYGKMIEDLGGGDACYTGPGWTGHIAFIEPDAPEFDAPLEEWKRLGPRIVTLSPFTIAQNSLHASFGKSGDLAMVPPKAATIGPAEVIASKYRMDMHALTVGGTSISWQRLMSRLVLHGPVTPRLPTSILQSLKTDVFVSESIARDIEPVWNEEY
jgi:6-phosphogluconolactonase/glucosamine-6-phosphate isomerase/deaminase